MEFWKSTKSRAAKSRAQNARVRSIRTASCSALENRLLFSTITVNTTTDVQDVASNATSVGATVSLRDAVIVATNLSGATEIDLPIGTYNLGNVGTGELRVGNIANQNISIKGLGTPANTLINQTISGNRIFNYDNNQVGTLTGSISNVTIENATNVNRLFGGGAILAGGLGDSLTLTNCVVQNNSTSNGSLAISRNGGAISYSGGGNLTIQNCQFLNNTAGGNANSGSAGGAIAYNNSTNSGNLTISNSTFSNDAATGLPGGAGGQAIGGALLITGAGTASITATTFTNDSAGGTSGAGGAINASSMTINIAGCRFFNNTAASGSGIYNTGASLTASGNWWGADSFPNSAGTDTVATTGGSTNISTRLALAISPALASIGTNSSTALTVKIVSTSAPTVAVTGTALEGLNLPFAPGTLGSVNPSAAPIANGTASTLYLSGAAFGTTSPSVTLDNGTKTTTVTVIGAPTANAQSVSVSFNTAKAIALTGSDPNAPPRSLTYLVATNPAHGTLSGTAPNLTYTPNAGYNGTDSFTFNVNNGVSSSNSATVSFNVSAGTPTANPQTVAVTFNTAKAIALTASDPDVPALPLTYAVATAPGHGTLSGTAPNLTYTPNAGYHGADSFMFTTNNGTNTSTPATVSLNVSTGTPTANPQSVSIAFNTTTAITLTGSDPDVPALPLTFVVAGAPGHGTLSGTAPNLTYTPNTGYHGADSFTFTVNNGTNTSAGAAISLNVAAGVPTANAQVVAVTFNTAKAVTLTGADPDVPALPLTYVVSTAPGHGTLSGTAPNLTYTPNAGYHGADSFTFTTNNGTNSSSPATVSLNISTGTPTANPQSVNTNQNTAVAITLTGSDPDSPQLPLSYTVTSNPAHGTLSGTAPLLTYTPNAGYDGPDSFQFSDSNGINTSAAATVSINVIATVATVSGTVGVSWGSAGTAALQTNADGLRLLPAGRNTDIGWYGVNRLSITLSQAKTLTAADVSVTGINIANYGPVTISGSGTSYTLTLAQPINAADRVTVTIGNAGIATFTRRLDVLPGDFNDDGGVTMQDAIGVRNQFLGIAGATPTILGDINGDGVVDINDYNQIRRLLGTTLP